MEKKKKKNYVIPAMEVVELEFQGSLLAGSGDTTFENTDLEDGNSYGGGGDMFD